MRKGNRQANSILFTLSVADNPIVFASDGFVKVTGYTRPEIVPRNCRFLQGAHTDRQAVARLRNAIHEQKESVELLLNYKKNGDPFWNLLYVGTSGTHSHLPPDIRILYL